MSYLGKVALKASDIRRLDVTSSTSATHTLSWTPPNEQSLIITINGVKQQNNYSISGVTLTLDSALTATDEMEVIGINDIGTTIAPADGTVTLPKISAGTGSAGQFLKTDGVGTLSWDSAGGTVGDITTANNFFQNWNEITTNTTSTFATSINAAIIGPITVTGSNVWTVSGILNIL